MERERPPIWNSLNKRKTVSSANLFAARRDSCNRRSERFGETAAGWVGKGQTSSVSKHVSVWQSAFGLRSMLAEFFQSHDVLIASASGCCACQNGESPTGLRKRLRFATWQKHASMCNFGAFSGLAAGALAIANPADEGLLPAPRCPNGASRERP